MMQPVPRTVSVLIVDDSAFVRRLIRAAVQDEAGIEICGDAANGKIALEQIATLSPDIVVLDLEMPVLNGLETLRAIRQDDHRLPVIVFSTLTTQGAATALEALALGATDYLAKPSHTGGPEESLRVVRDGLVPRLQMISRDLLSREYFVNDCGARGGDRIADREERNALSPGSRARLAIGHRRPKIIAIGASTGGPHALASLLGALPTDFSVPIVIAQHLPPKLIPLLAEHLDRISDLRVQPAYDGAILEASTVWIAPGDRDLSFSDPHESCDPVRLVLSDRAGGRVDFPAVDQLFEAVIGRYADRALAIVLTGMGRDGLEGGRSFCDAGAALIAQDRNSSALWGMPGALVHAGLAEKVLPLDKIANEMVKRIR